MGGRDEDKIESIRPKLSRGNKAMDAEYVKMAKDGTISVDTELVKGPESEKEPEETQPYRKTDIQLPSDTAAADKEFRMLDKFFNYVSKLTLSENFDLEI